MELPDYLQNIDDPQLLKEAIKALVSELEQRHGWTRDKITETIGVILRKDEKADEEFFSEELSSSAEFVEGFLHEFLAPFNKMQLPLYNPVKEGEEIYDEYGSPKRFELCDVELGSKGSRVYVFVEEGVVFFRLILPNDQYLKGQTVKLLVPVSSLRNTKKLLYESSPDKILKRVVEVNGEKFLELERMLFPVSPTQTGAEIHFKLEPEMLQHSKDRQVSFLQISGGYIDPSTMD